jgi:hypothetical protein
MGSRILEEKKVGFEEKKVGFEGIENLEKVGA